MLHGLISPPQKEIVNTLRLCLTIKKKINLFIPVCTTKTKAVVIYILYFQAHISSNIIIKTQIYFFISVSIHTERGAPEKLRLYSSTIRYRSCI